MDSCKGGGKDCVPPLQALSPVREMQSKGKTALGKLGSGSR